MRNWHHSHIYLHSHWSLNMDGEGAGEGEWELRGHETSVPNNSSTDAVVSAKARMKVLQAALLWGLPPTATAQTPNPAHQVPGTELTGGENVYMDH